MIFESFSHDYHQGMYFNWLQTFKDHPNTFFVDTSANCQRSLEGGKMG
jgi:hypothetical protein